MNLHGIVSGIVSAVNPMQEVTIEVSIGNVTLEDGSRVPKYAKPVKRMAQIQPLTSGDIQHLDSLNIQGVFQGIYISGHLDGLIRSDNKGGDRITFPDGKVYLVTTSIEDWPDWTKVAASLQNGA